MNTDDLAGFLKDLTCGEEVPMDELMADVIREVARERNIVRFENRQNSVKVHFIFSVLPNAVSRILVYGILCCDSD